MGFSIHTEINVEIGGVRIKIGSSFHDFPQLVCIFDVFVFFLRVAMTLGSSISGKYNVVKFLAHRDAGFLNCSEDIENTPNIACTFGSCQKMDEGVFVGSVSSLFHLLEYCKGVFVSIDSARVCLQ